VSRAEQAPGAAPPPFVAKLGDFYDRSERYTPLLGTLVGKGIFVVRTEDKHVGRSLFAKGGRGEISVLARAVNVLKALYGDEVIDGTTFIDVGANIGTTTIPALLEHEFGNAVAIEPEHDNYVTLRANAVLNELDDRVIALRAAASNVVGKSELVVNRSQGGKHWIATDEEKRSRADGGSEVVEVETVTLDGLAEQGVIDVERTGMLWMDAQGHEGHIIQGASAFTARGVPIVLEWDPKGLDEVGDRGKIEALAAENYTHFGGMRADNSGEAPKFWLREIAGLNDYAKRFLGRSRTQVFTDILLVRLTEEEVPDRRVGDYIDMSTVIREQTLLNRLLVEAAGSDELLRHPSEKDRLTFRARQKAQEAKRQRAETKRTHAEQKLARRKRQSPNQTEVAQAEKPKSPTGTPAAAVPRSTKGRATRSKQPSGSQAAGKENKPSPKPSARGGAERTNTSPYSAKPSTPRRRSSRSPATKSAAKPDDGMGARGAKSTRRSTASTKKPSPPTEDPR
jgi:FkbM family methyltransferase